MVIMNSIINNNIIPTTTVGLSTAPSTPSKGALEARKEKKERLKEKMDFFNQLRTSKSLTKKEINAQLQLIFKEAKGLFPIDPTKTDFVGGDFGNVRIYHLAGLTDISNALNENISSSMDVQQSLMSLEEDVENLSVAWSDYYTKILAADEQKVQDIASGKIPSSSDQAKATAVSAATSQYNLDSTDMQTVGTNYNSQNNLLSNGVANVGQNMSTDGAEIQQVVTKIMDGLSRILGQI